MFGILVVHILVHQEEDMFHMREMLRLKTVTEDSIAANKAKIRVGYCFRAFPRKLLLSSADSHDWQRGSTAA